MSPQSHAISEPEHWPDACSQKLSGPTELIQKALTCSPHCIALEYVENDNWRRLRISFACIFNFVVTTMNVGDDEVLKQLSDECSKLNNQPFRLLFRDATYAIFMNPTVVIAWHVSSKSRGWGDVSPKHESERRSPELMTGRVSLSMSNHFGACPIGIPWREVYSKNKVDVYQSILLFPSGLRCSDSVKLIEVLKRERLAIAVVTSGDRLVVFSDSGPDESVLVGERAFNVEVMVDIEGLHIPNSLSIQPSSSSRGESLFLTDSESDRVCEIRFDSTILGVPRSCPDVSLLYWTLESGIPAASGCRLSVRPSPDGSTSLQIVGVGSNGDSQGLVQLLAARNDWFPSSKNETIEMSVFHINNFLFSNCDRSFRILSVSDFDFPRFIRGPLAQVRVLEIDGKIFIFALATSVLRIFRFADFELVPTSVPCFEGVLRFDVATCRAGDGVIVAIEKSDSITLYYVNLESGNFSFANEISARSAACKSLSVRTPLAEEDVATVAFVSADGKLGGSDQLLSIRKSLEDEVCVHCLLTEEHLAVLTEEKRLYMFSLMMMGGPPDIVGLPNNAQSSMSYHRNGADLVIIVGDVLVRRSFDPLTGVAWSVHPSGLGGSISVGTDCMYAVNAKGHISIGAFPPAEIRDSTDCLLQECLEGAVPNDTAWYTLPSELRSSVERYLGSSSETHRASDLFARRFLIAAAFSRLTFEDLALAALSDSQSFIVSELFAAPTVTWEQLRVYGMAYWCSEPALFKELAEKVQKSALQLYMQTKDPLVLDERLAVWLAALGKQQLLASLYKQHGNSCASPGHTRIAQFLSIDFSVPENTSKAIKNAFELVRQKRNGMAVAVFLLAGAFQEAADICSRQMRDVQLALFVLNLLKTRVGIDQSAIQQMIESVWENRIVSTLNEAGDVFMPLTFSWMRKDMHAAMAVVRHESTTQLAPDSELGAFKIRPSSLSGVNALLLTLVDRMKKLNRPVPSDAESLRPSSDEERAYVFLQTGCARLAARSPLLSSFNPALRWAIQNNLSS